MSLNLKVLVSYDRTHDDEIIVGRGILSSELNPKKTFGMLKEVVEDFRKQRSFKAVSLENNTLETKKDFWMILRKHCQDTIIKNTSVIHDEIRFWAGYPLYRILKSDSRSGFYSQLNTCVSDGEGETGKQFTIIITHKQLHDMVNKQFKKLVESTKPMDAIPSGSVSSATLSADGKYHEGASTCKDNVTYLASTGKVQPRHFSLIDAPVAVHSLYSSINQTAYYRAHYTSTHPHGECAHRVAHNTNPNIFTIPAADSGQYPLHAPAGNGIIASRHDHPFGLYLPIHGTHFARPRRHSNQLQQVSVLKDLVLDVNSRLGQKEVVESLDCTDIFSLHQQILKAKQILDAKARVRDCTPWSHSINENSTNRDMHSSTPTALPRGSSCPKRERDIGSSLSFSSMGARKDEFSSKTKVTKK